MSNFSMATFMNYINVITGLFEVVFLFGFSGSFYFVGTIMVENGHFCDPDLLQDIVTSTNQTLTYIKSCPPEFKTTQFNRMSLIVMLGIRDMHNK